MQAFSIFRHHFSLFMLLLYLFFFATVETESKIAILKITERRRIPNVASNGRYRRLDFLEKFCTSFIRINVKRKTETTILGVNDYYAAWIQESGIDPY